MKAEKPQDLLGLSFFGENPPQVGSGLRRGSSNNDNRRNATIAIPEKRTGLKEIR